MISPSCFFLSFLPARFFETPGGSPRRNGATLYILTRKSGRYKQLGGGTNPTCPQVIKAIDKGEKEEEEEEALGSGRRRGFLHFGRRPSRNKRATMNPNNRWRKAKREEEEEELAIIQKSIQVSLRYRYTLTLSLLPASIVIRVSSSAGSLSC